MARTRFTSADVAAGRKAHVDDVALGRRDRDVIDPRFALVAPKIGGDDFHARVALKRQIEDARARHVGEEKAHDLAAANTRLPARLAVDQEHIAESSHQRVRGRFVAVTDRSTVGNEQVVEHQHFIAVGGRVIAGIARRDQQVAVEAEILQHVLAMVRVIPVDTRIAEMHAVFERLARRDRILRQMRHTVESIVQPDAVPMDGRRKVRAIDEAHRNRRRFVDLDQRSGVLAVETQHGDRATEQHAANRRRRQRQRIAVGHAHELARARERRRLLTAPEDTTTRPAAAT